MKTCKVSDLFVVEYGANLELNALELDSRGINFVSRTSKNNGVSAKVKRLIDIDPLPAGTITVAGGGSVMESFLQIKPYYSGRDLYYLTAKKEMSNAVKLFYCLCLKANKFKFSYGRQANVTLPELLIPTIEEVPSFVKNFSIKQYGNALLERLKRNNLPISYNDVNRATVPLSTIFEIRNGLASSAVIRNPYKENENWIPYIRPSYRQETSIDAYVNKTIIDEKYVFPKDTLYTSTDGQGSHTYSYVSVFEFVPNSNVAVLIPKRLMSLQEKLFYAYCITNNRYKFSYGRKPKGDRLSMMLLPEFATEEVLKFDFNQIINQFTNSLDKLA